MYQSTTNIKRTVKMNIVDSEKIIMLIKREILPSTKIEILFLDGFTSALAGILLKTCLKESIAIDNISYEDFMNYILGYSIGQMYERDDEGLIGNDEPQTIQ